MCMCTYECAYIYHRVVGAVVRVQSASIRVAIMNHSQLPQSFAFVGLPVEFTVPYNDGFGTLLPQETIFREIVFSPTTATG
jgi:hypothetical protein